MQVYDRILRVIDKFCGLVDKFRGVFDNLPPFLTWLDQTYIFSTQSTSNHTVVVYQSRGDHEMAVGPVSSWT